MDKVDSLLNPSDYFWSSFILMTNTFFSKTIYLLKNILFTTIIVLFIYSR